MDVTLISLHSPLIVPVRVPPPTKRPNHGMKHLALYLCVFSAPLLLGQSSAAAEKSGPRFETEVRSILKAHCWQCHGEADEKKGGLDTRLARFLIKGGESGPAIVPGKHTDSRLFKRVASGEMPPGAKRLSARDVEVLARWIDAGARTVRPEPASLADGSFTVEERQHWSFRPIRRPPSPAVQHGELLQSPIDAFLLAKLESRGQGFGPEADRPTLVRRLAFDLHGLPPGPGVVERFVSDRAPGAWSRLVDRLLASPAYGERWARHWLDVVGYADSDGVTQKDRPRNWSFKYRDYTIRALNADKPWNEFVVEQLAGDELVTPPHQDLSAEQADRLIATGFLRMAPDGTSGSGANQELASNQVVAEVIKVVSTSLLGLTVGCAQCHQHRYDPITHADYYRLRALFEPAYDPKHWRSPSGRLVSQWDKNVRETVAVIDKKLAEITSGKNAELEAAVKKLPPTGEVCLIFFSGPSWLAGENAKAISNQWHGDNNKGWKPKPGFKPSKPKWIPVTPAHQKRLSKTIWSTPLTFGSVWDNSFRWALTLLYPKPDVIYFMTDGATRNPQETVEKVKRNRAIQVNSIAFGIPNAQAEEPMREMAKATRGTFKSYSKQQIGKMAAKF